MLDTTKSMQELLESWKQRSKARKVSSNASQVDYMHEEKRLGNGRSQLRRMLRQLKHCRLHQFTYITWQVKQTKTQTNIQNRHECMRQYFSIYNSYCTIKIQMSMTLSHQKFEKADMVGDSWILWVVTYGWTWPNTLRSPGEVQQLGENERQREQRSGAAKDLRLGGAEVLIHRLWALETCSWQKQIQPKTPTCCFLEIKYDHIMNSSDVGAFLLYGYLVWKERSPFLKL